jgi:hypothetical protein
MMIGTVRIVSMRALACMKRSMTFSEVYAGYMGLLARIMVLHDRILLSL